MLCVRACGCVCCVRAGVNVCGWLAAAAPQHLHRLGRTARAGRGGRATHVVCLGSPAVELAATIQGAEQGGVPLEEAFSRKRGFRKKIKKQGKPFNAKANQRRN